MRFALRTAIDYVPRFPESPIRNIVMPLPPSQRFPAPALDTLPDDIRTRLLAVQE